MQSFKSGSQGSALSDVKELLEIIADSSKFKKAIDELDERYSEALKQEQEAANKLSLVLTTESSFESKKEFIEKASLNLKEREDEVSAKVTKFNKLESELYLKDKQLQDSIAKFEEFKALKEKELNERLNVAEAKYKEAYDLNAVATELKKEFELKLASIKSLAN